MNRLNLLMKLSIGQSTQYKTCYAFILFFSQKTVRILVKWYLNELLRYLIMSFTSIQVIANDKT